MNKFLMATAALALGATTAVADVKIGMITTLSGGGAGLGIDVRDGFMLAVAQSGRSDIDVVIEDDLALSGGGGWPADGGHHSGGGDVGDPRCHGLSAHRSL